MIGRLEREILWSQTQSRMDYDRLERGNKYTITIHQTNEAT